MLESGEHDAAVKLAARWIDNDDQAAYAHTALMTALARSGRTEEALKHFESYERTLREEEGRTPPAELRELAEELRKNPTKSSVPAEVVALPAKQTTVHIGFDQPIPLPAPRVATSRRIVSTVLAGLVLILGFTVLVKQWPNRSGAVAIPLDSMVIGLFPFEYQSQGTDPLLEVDRMNDALRRWTGIRSGDQLRIAAELKRVPEQNLSIDRAAEIARSVGAGRFFFGVVSGTPSDRRVDVAMYDAEKPRVRLAASMARIGDFPSVDSLFFHLIDRLLLEHGGNLRAQAVPGTTSLPAQIAFDRARTALESWDLQAADSGFMQAHREDPEFAEAAMWLAFIRSWRRDPAEWSFAANRAAVNAARLPAADTAIVNALLALAAGRTSVACAAYRRLTVDRPGDFAPWFAYGNCLTRDRFIQPDNTSPSGWAFRSSYHEGVQAVAKAFELLPSAHLGLSDDLFREFRKLLKTSEVDTRSGRSANNALFYAHPGWDNDSLTFVPYPFAQFNAGQIDTTAASVGQAVLEQRTVFQRLARGWLSAYPQSSRALLAFAMALHLAGDRAAIDSLERAITLADDSHDRAFLNAVSVLVSIQHALPDDIELLDSAVKRADSLFKAFPPGQEPDAPLYAGMAALRGRPALAVDYISRTNGPAGYPSQLYAAGHRLLVYATFGYRPDSIRYLYDRIMTESESLSDPALRSMAIHEVLTRAVTTGFPHLPRDLGDELESSFYLRVAQQEWLRGQRPAARARLSGTARNRRATGFTSVSFDALYPEASLLSALRDTAAAVRLLDEGFRHLDRLSPDDFEDPIRSAALGRALLLRAQLASAQNQLAEARKWSTALLTLWQGSEVLTRSQRREIQDLTRRPRTRKR